MKRDLLIIERNSRDSLASRLSAEGYSVCLAATGTEALEALNRHNITHAVILNAISMRTNGTRTCASLKRAAPGIPILIYSDQKKPAKADMLLSPDISTRKLINRVELYSPLDCHTCVQMSFVDNILMQIIITPNFQITFDEVVRQIGEPDCLTARPLIPEVVNCQVRAIAFPHSMSVIPAQVGFHQIQRS